jgi:phage terminase large subunit
MAAVFGYAEPLRILCTREFQASIKESMFAELRGAINAHPFLRDHYEIGESYIRGRNGTEFLFRGLRVNMSSIKSTAGIDICIIEEAEDVPEHSWRDLTPTIRAPGSEIWPIWNPRTKGSPVDQRFRQGEAPPRAVIAEINASDNPWLPPVLREEMEHSRVNDSPEVFAHVWEGAYLEIGEAQVLHGKIRVAPVPEAVPDDCDGPYYGADWGFSTDPTALIRFYRARDGRRLYISHEAYAPGVEVVDLGALFERVPESGAHVIRADNARPEIISHMRNEGWRIQAADKWPGSVEDGVTWLRSHQEVIIDPRCPNTIREGRLWSYKVDRQTGDPLPVLVDANNHAWDAIRYGAQPMIRPRNASPGIRQL